MNERYPTTKNSTAFRFLRRSLSLHLAKEAQCVLFAGATKLNGGTLA